MDNMEKNIFKKNITYKVTIGEGIGYKFGFKERAK